MRSLAFRPSGVDRAPLATNHARDYYHPVRARAVRRSAAKPVEPHIGPGLATAREAKARLLQLVSGTAYGARASSEQTRQVQAAIEELAAAADCHAGAAGAGAADAATAADAAALDGAWRLLYTSEAAVHGIVRSLPVSRIGQRIDLRSGRVTNAIDFGWPSKAAATHPGGGGGGEGGRGGGGSGFGLRAGAPLRVAGTNRIQYRFDSFKLLLPWRLPGAGSTAARGGGAAGATAASGAEAEAEAGRAAVPLPPPRAGGWTQAVFVDADVRVMRNSRGDTLMFVRE